MSVQHSTIAAASPAAGSAGVLGTQTGFYQAGTYFEDAALKTLIAKATDYVAAGVALNISGPAGLGKTSLALRLAETRNRPMAFMTGNQWLGSSDMVGSIVGQKSRTVVDKYIQSVRRTDEETRDTWKDSILSIAMQRGYTLVYDEFTRASPEVNAMLLSVLEEGLLAITDRASGRSFIKADSEFRIILTSNPHDYVAVNTAPDALIDRMVTLPMPEPSIEALAGIVALRSGLPKKWATQVVDMVSQTLSQLGAAQGSRMRASLHVGRIAAHKADNSKLSTAVLQEIVNDVLNGRTFTNTIVQTPPHNTSSRQPSDTMRKAG